MQVRELREIVGGRWAISWQLYCLNAPFAIGAVPLAQLADDRNAPLLLWTFTSAAGYLGAAPLLWIAERTVFRNRATHPVPITAVAIFGFALGFVKSLFTTGLTQLLSPDLAIPGIPLRATVTGLTIAATLPIGAYIMHQFDQVRQQRFALLEERIRYSQLQLQEQELARQLRLTAVEAVSSDISNSMNAIRKTMQQTEQWDLEARWNALSDTITEIAQSRIRPLSRELWKRSTTLLPSLRVRDLLKIALVKYCMSPGLTSLIYGLSVFAWGAQRNGVGMQTLWTILVSGIIFFLSVPTRFIVRRYDSLPLALALPALSGTVIAGLAAPFNFQSNIGSVEASMLVTTIWMAFVNVFAAFGAAAIAGPSALLQRLENEVSDQRVRAWAAQRETRRISRELAKHIHGRLQSRLMAASLAQGSPESTNLADLERTLASPLDEFLNPADSTIEEAIARACENWQGLLDVSYRIDPQVHVLGADAEFLGAVIEEALTNASRHGWADKAEITLDRAGASIVLEVSDNGVGPRIGEPGLGTKLYSSDPRATWSLEPRDGGGSTLQLQLPAA